MRMRRPRVRDGSKRLPRMIDGGRSGCLAELYDCAGRVLLLVAVSGVYCIAWIYDDGAVSRWWTD